jgi:trimethylamine:corrinoid methyltransferase-like protein
MAYAYDFFIDENPDVIERVDRRGREALQEGSLRTSRKIALNYVQRRFPALTLLAQQRVAHISQIEPLETLLDQLFGATSEDEARKLLEAQGN